VVPYAVELGVKVREERGSAREIRGLEIRDAYLHVEEWAVRWCEYRLHNRTEQPMMVLVEHPRRANYELYDTAEPKERTEDHLRFEVEVPPHAEAKLRVQERSLVGRREELQKQSYEGLQRYLQQGVLDQATYDSVAQLLDLWEKIANNERRLRDADQQRQKIYQAQQQIQGNMGALSATGKERSLRNRYVEQLEGTEDELRQIEGQEADLRAAIQSLKQEVAERLEALR
jgi:hypothetical protein